MRLQHRRFPVNIAKNFKNSPFHRAPVATFMSSTSCKYILTLFSNCNVGSSLKCKRHFSFLIWLAYVIFLRNTKTDDCIIKYADNSNQKANVMSFFLLQGYKTLFKGTHADLKEVVKTLYTFLPCSRFHVGMVLGTLSGAQSTFKRMGFKKLSRFFLIK